MTKRKSSHHTSTNTISHTTEPPAKRLRPSVLPPLPPITPELEQYVFTHPSAASKTTTNLPVHYDRLEFLGDAHLQLIATTMIYERYPTANAGRMAQIRQQLVQNETLCQYALMYGFDKRLKININPSSSSATTTSSNNNTKGKFSLTKVYGDVFEAYLGAIILSSPSPTLGTSTATTFLHTLWTPLFTTLLLKFPPDQHGQKEILATKLLIPGVRLDYVEEKKPIVHMGKGIETFFLGVYLTGWGYRNQHLGSGSGMSKVQAGQAAAGQALETRVVQECEARKREWVRDREAQGKVGGEEGGDGKGE